MRINVMNLSTTLQYAMFTLSDQTQQMFCVNNHYAHGFTLINCIWTKSHISDTVIYMYLIMN